MICPHCQTSNPPGATFCLQCGSALFDQPESLALDTPIDASMPTIPVTDAPPPYAPAQPYITGAPAPSQSYEPFVAAPAPQPYPPYAPPPSQSVQPSAAPFSQPSRTPLPQAIAGTPPSWPLAAPGTPIARPQRGPLTPGISLGLLVAGIVVLVIALLEHFLGPVLQIQLLPHLAIILGVIAAALIGAGAYGLVGGNRS